MDKKVFCLKGNSQPGLKCDAQASSSFSIHAAERGHLLFLLLQLYKCYINMSKAIELAIPSFLYLPNHLLVSSVGWVPDCRVGVEGSSPGWTNTQGLKKIN